MYKGSREYPSCWVGGGNAGGGDVMRLFAYLVVCLSCLWIESMGWIDRLIDWVNGLMLLLGAPGCY